MISVSISDQPRRAASGSSSDQRASQTSPQPRKLASAAPFYVRCCRGPNRERTSGLCASGRRRRLVLAVGSCPAQPPTGPNRAAAGLLIRPTVTAGIHTHDVLRSVRQQHAWPSMALRRVQSVKTATHGPAPVQKKIRDRSGPVLDRPGPEPGTGPVLTLTKTNRNSDVTYTGGAVLTLML